MRYDSGRCCSAASALAIIGMLAACATSPRAARGPSSTTSAASTARLPGADFSALGQEPGWRMDIADGEKIVLVTDYGENRYEFAAPRPDSSDGETKYVVSTAEHRLISVIEDKPCTDSMSGRAFPATVTVTIDGKEYRGCGGPPR